MHLKTYRSATVREALAQARAELGPNALVVSTRLVAVDGVRGMMGAREVEVTATRDSAVEAGLSETRPAARGADMLAPAAASRPRARAPRFDDAAFRPAPRPAAAAAAAGTVMGAAAAGARRAPLTDLRQRVSADQRSAVRDSAVADVPWEYRDEELTGASRWLVEEPDVRDPHVEALVSRLSATGLHRELAVGIARAVPREHRRNGSLVLLERAVAAHLDPLAAGDEPFAAVELFVGPPGAGKTTTIAKIAAQERARRGQKLSLLAADGFRVGAVEQLRIYADILGAPFAIARTPAEIERSLLTTRGTVLVDTAGRSVRDPRALEVVAMLAGIPGVRTHLVLAAATPARDVHRLLDAYGRRRPNRVVLTRVDEAESVSPLMHIFKERGLKVSYLGTGQRVPEDLERATPQRLAAHVLGHGLPEGLPA